MTSSASISIIIRTFDRNRLLTDALESLTNQTRKDFEVIVVDMNSVAATDVLQQFRRTLSRVVHIREGRLLNGPAAMNLGIRNATSDKIAVLDDDNRYDPTHLEVLVDGLEKTRADLVYTGARRATHTPSGELIDVAVWHQPYDLALLLLGNYIHTVGTAFWKSTWERLGGFDTRFPVYDDYEFLLRVALSGRIECLPAVTGESRSFTGTPGVQNHALQPKDIARCQAGLYWTHRDLFFPPGRRRSAYAALLRAKQINNGGAQPQAAIRTAFFTAKMVRDLASWWYHG